MYKTRVSLYQDLEARRKSKVLAFITGDRPGLETQIHSEVYDFFVSHLDSIGVVPRISLFLYTRGGDTLAAWSLVNLIWMFCDELEVIIPSKAHSAGTLISLGANKILMTKQATLGPIDPSVNTPLNPQIPGAPPEARFPVSVEAIRGFTELAQGELKITNQSDLASILNKLIDKIHPLVLGQVYRARSQIQMLAKKLVAKQISDPEKVETVISFLCSDSGSHDYAIHRREAKEILGLNIEKPDADTYNVVKKIYDDIEADLELNTRFDPKSHLGGQNSKRYLFRRALVESILGGSHFLSSEGTLTKINMPLPPGVVGIPQMAIKDDRDFEGWKYEKN